MNASLSFFILAIFIIVYNLIIEFFTILFRLTGLTYDTSRMQVISLLTNSGFTTSESEVILHSKRRRRLAQMTMLFGYAFTVIIVSTIVNAFFSLSSTEIDKILPTIVFTAILVLFILIIFRVPFIHNIVNHLLERAANKIMFGKHSNTTVLVDTYGKNAIVEVLLDYVPEKVRNVPLSRCGLREDMNIQVLHIKRAHEAALLDGDTIIQQGDALLLFGTYKNIRKVFENVE